MSITSLKKSVVSLISLLALLSALVLGLARFEASNASHNLLRNHTTIQHVISASPKMRSHHS